MTGPRENSSTSFLGVFSQFIACLGRSKVRDSQSQTYRPSRANGEELLKEREKCIVAPGRGYTFNETISSRHRRTDNMQPTAYDTAGLFIRTADTNRAASAPSTPIHDEGCSSICAHLQVIRVVKVICIHYDLFSMKTATLCIELDVNGRRESRWLAYHDLIKTPGEKEVIPGAKDAIKRFRPTWIY